MFGYLTADISNLTEEELARYKECYCGLCRELGTRHGLVSRVTLTYDMTFLILLLNSLYEPDETTEEKRCARHPHSPCRSWRSKMTAYAADMNLMLAYYKCRDDWEDDSSAAALIGSAALRRQLLHLEETYPRQSGSIKENLKQLHELEQEGGFCPDEASECFGRMLGDIFVLYRDRWSWALYRLGESLGKFIYLLDAAMDLEKDTLRNRFNPFRRYYGLPSNGDRFREILELTLTDCVNAFDYLPLVKDTAILKNILCSGLWIEFNKKYERDPANDKGSL